MTQRMQRPRWALHSDAERQRARMLEHTQPEQIGKEVEVYVACWQKDQGSALH